MRIHTGMGTLKLVGCRDLPLGYAIFVTTSNRVTIKVPSLAYHLNLGLIFVVRNYYSELLMHPLYRRGDLTAAENLLNMTIDEVEKTKFYRSKIVALSLLGKLALLRHDTFSAYKHSTMAVEYLQRMGTMPLVRSEEIFFNHYGVLKTMPDRLQEAKKYLDISFSILQQKANSIENEKYKCLYLERVPLSREIISAKSTLSLNS